MSNIAAKTPRHASQEAGGASDAPARPSLSDADLLAVLIESVSAKPAPARVFELGVILNDEHHRNLILLALRSMPDMLAALRDAYAEIRHARDNARFSDGGHRAPAALCNTLRAAMAKAEGRS